ncbi:MAG: lipopolysaccharide heptosyltransferase II [Acidobacteriota bacterium]
MKGKKPRHAPGEAEPRPRPFPPGKKQGEEILVRGTNWVGDSVMSLPALRELRRLYPQSRITLLVRKWVAAIFQDQQLVDEIRPLPESRTMRRRLMAIRGLPRHFDRAVLLPNSFEVALSAFMAGIPERIGYRTDGRGLLLTRRATPRIRTLKRHQTYYYLDLLHQTGLSGIDYLNDASFQPDLRLKPSPEGMRAAQSLLEQAGVQAGSRRVLINPGAIFGPAKRWFLDRYGLLADRLMESEKVEVLIIGSPGELGLAHEIANSMRRCPYILTGKTNLASLMGLLASCDLLITNDSGPMHLAAALDVPQVALFGSTDEIATGPLSTRAHVIHKHVRCSPCLLRECPIDVRCFDRISVEEVLQTAREVLHSPSPNSS